MTAYGDMSTAELSSLKGELEKKLQEYRDMGLSLDMTRGRPSKAQLELSMPMLDTLDSESDLYASDGTDVRNYGGLRGLPEARTLLAGMMGARPEQVIVCGSSSLNIMFDCVSRAYAVGVDGHEPWCRQEGVKFLCPSPGYDRHFAITEHFGIEMVPIEMSPTGPDMAEIKRLVESDPGVKGVWCVPQYSNPQGYTYSDETVEAFAALEPAAPDFRVFWDNSYVVHHLYDEPEKQDHVANVLEACERAGHPDVVWEFCSTSKVTFAGSGIAGVAASEKNLAEIAKGIGVQTICYDKVNQLRHVRFLKDADGIAAHMSKHAALLRPKFEAVLGILEEELGETGTCTWTKPRGGYFISFVGPEGTAKRTVELAASAGVKMTGAGATWPLHHDPHDADVRIAPSIPELPELELAMHVFATCSKLATVEKLLA